MSNWRGMVLGCIDWLWDMLAVTLVFYEEEHRVTLVVILTLLCGSVNSPLSNQPGGKSQYPISRGGKHIRSDALSLPPLLLILQLLKCAPQSPQSAPALVSFTCPGAAAALACRERRPCSAPARGAIVVDSQTPIIRTFKVSFYSRLPMPPSLSLSLLASLFPPPLGT